MSKLAFDIYGNPICCDLCKKQLEESDLGHSMCDSCGRVYCKEHLGKHGAKFYRERGMQV